MTKGLLETMIPRDEYWNPIYTQIPQKLVNYSTRNV